MSHFAFLDAEWPVGISETFCLLGVSGEDQRTACFYSRRTLELAVDWAYTHDKALRIPYQDNLAALLQKPPPAWCSKQDCYYCVSGHSSWSI